MMRRFEKRIYIGLPDEISRISLLKIHCGEQQITEEEFTTLGKMLEGYSGSDIATVVVRNYSILIFSFFSQKDAFMEPVREIQEATHWKEVSQNSWIPTNCEDPLAVVTSFVALGTDKIASPRLVTMVTTLKAKNNVYRAILKRALQRIHQAFKLKSYHFFKSSQKSEECFHSFVYYHVVVVLEDKGLNLFLALFALNTFVST
jgi:SpoVK/Ycf46/Vps4 family AAA+-type ATPase